MIIIVKAAGIIYNSLSLITTQVKNSLLRSLMFDLP